MRLSTCTWSLQPLPRSAGMFQWPGHLLLPPPPLLCNRHCAEGSAQQHNNDPGLTGRSSAGTPKPLGHLLLLLPLLVLNRHCAEGRAQQLGVPGLTGRSSAGISMLMSPAAVVAAAASVIPQALC
jgi:hypothetical protein